MENFRLRVFRAVARHRNFRMAAEDLRLTQPAVTQQVKALEAELATALFDRTGGKVSLSPAGHALLPFAERLAALANQAREAVAAASADAHAGSLTIAASQTVGQYLLPRLIAGFLAENPHVEIAVSSGNTHFALDQLHERVADIALIEGPAMRQDVRVEPFLRDQMALVVPAGHEWAGRTIDLAHLARAPLLIRELGSGSRRIVEDAIKSSGLRLRDLNIRMTFDSTEGLLTGVEAGLGVAFVSRWAVRAQLALGTLRVARVRDLDLTRMFSLATLAGPEPGGLTGAFHRFVLGYAAAPAPKPPRQSLSKAKST